MDKDRVNQILNDLKSARYCCFRIIHLNEELIMLDHKMTGLGHNSPRLTPEQEKSMKPMPVFHGTGFTSIVSMIAEKDKIKEEIDYYRRRLNECKPIELLSIKDQNILFDLYFNDITSSEVAKKYGYTNSSIYKHIKAELSKII